MERVYISGCCARAEEMSPSARTWRVSNRIPAISRSATPAVMATALVPHSTQRDVFSSSLAIAAPNRVIVARVAHVQKAQHVLIHEVEPQEPFVVAGAAMHAEDKEWRIAQRSQNVPRCGDEQHDGDAGDRPQPLPRSPPKQLPRD